MKHPLMKMKFALIISVEVAESTVDYLIHLISEYPKIGKKLLKHSLDNLFQLRK